MARSRARSPGGGASVRGSFVAYLRVSTDQQGRSGLGLEAQRASVGDYVTRQGGRIVAEMVEVESGKRNERPQLKAALAACRTRRAILIVAKLDRLARNARFLLDVVEGAGEGGVVFCDLPEIPPGPVGKFLVSQMAAVAELEAGLISQRTRAALAAAKARGKRLGGPRLKAGTRDAAEVAREAHVAQAEAYREDLRPYVADAIAAGANSLGKIGKALQARGVRAPNGGEAWHTGQVFRLLRRLDLRLSPQGNPGEAARGAGDHR